MLRKEGDKIYGVLNDFDLAVCMDVNSPSSKQQTGTKPFMAIDLLRPDLTVHMYHHDLESMFYVLVWITSHFHEGKEIADPPLQDWTDHGGMALVEKKTMFIMSPLPRRMAKFESFRGWVASMVRMIQDGFSVRVNYLTDLSVGGPQTSVPLHLEDEMLGSLVTFEAILETRLL